MGRTTCGGQKDVLWKMLCLEYRIEKDPYRDGLPRRRKLIATFNVDVATNKVRWRGVVEAANVRYLDGPFNKPVKKELIICTILVAILAPFFVRLEGFRSLSSRNTTVRIPRFRTVVWWRSVHNFLFCIQQHEWICRTSWPFPFVVVRSSECCREESRGWKQIEKSNSKIENGLSPEKERRDGYIVVADRFSNPLVLTQQLRTLSAY